MNALRNLGFGQLLKGVDFFVQVLLTRTTGNFDQGTAIIGIAEGLAQTMQGTNHSFQGLFEEIAQLHQKIDRLEAKMGSVPRK